MKIWQLCTPRELFSEETGGAVASVVADLSRELVALGHDVSVAARVDGTRLHHTGGSFVALGEVPWPRSFPTRLRWRYETAINRAFGWPWPAYSGYLRALRAELRRRPVPEVVVVHNDPFAVRYLHRWARGATVVLWMHNIPYRLPRRRRGADRAELVVTVSDYLAEKVAPRLGVERADIVTVHNGVDAQAFHPRRGFDEPTTPLRVLCLGRLDEFKGADVALAAVCDLQAEGTAIELDVVGSPWFAPTPRVPRSNWGEQFVLDLAAAGAHHTPHVPRPEVMEITRAHDVVCVLSRWEDPFPLVVLEAMASGCAVVATERGGIPEAAGDAARYVAPDDPAAVAAVLREFASDPSSLAAAKGSARQRATECTWRRATLTFLHALARVGVPATPPAGTGPDAPRPAGRSETVT